MIDAVVAPVDGTSAGAGKGVCVGVGAGVAWGAVVGAGGGVGATVAVGKGCAAGGAGVGEGCAAAGGEGVGEGSPPQAIAATPRRPATIIRRYLDRCVISCFLS